MNQQYRVTHLLANFGWYDFGCSTLCPILLGLVEIWQKRQGSWARWWNIPNQSQPNRGSPGDVSPGSRFRRKNRRRGVSLVCKEDCTSLEQRNPHFSGDAAPPPPISEDDSSQNACLKEEEKAGKSAAAEASAALNVPIYLPAANMLLRKTHRQFLERERPRGREVLGADRGFFQHQDQCHAFKGCCNWRISPVGQSWREKTDCVLFCLVMRWTEHHM